MTTTAKLITDAREAWPTIDVDEAVFLAAIAEHAASPDALAELRAADLWLACAARAGHVQAVRIVDGYLKTIAPAPSPIFRKQHIWNSGSRTSARRSWL